MDSTFPLITRFLVQFSSLIFCFNSDRETRQQIKRSIPKSGKDDRRDTELYAHITVKRRKNYLRLRLCASVCVCVCACVCVCVCVCVSVCTVCALVCASVCASRCAMCVRLCARLCARLGVHCVCVCLCVSVCLCASVVLLGARACVRVFVCVLLGCVGNE